MKTSSECPDDVPELKGLENSFRVFNEDVRRLKAEHVALPYKTAANGFAGLFRFFGVAFFNGLKNDGIELADGFALT